jgi:AraC-like DNA-binding protein
MGRPMANLLRVVQRAFRRSQRLESRSQRSFGAHELSGKTSPHSVDREVRGHTRDPEILSGMDRDFLDLMMGVVSRHLSDADFDTITAAREMRLSRMHLNRKLRMLTGYSTREFILSVRFSRAREMLLMRFPDISEIARFVGFRSSSRFSKSFRKHFGQTPADFLRDEPL